MTFCLHSCSRHIPQRLVVYSSISIDRLVPFRNCFSTKSPRAPLLDNTTAPSIRSIRSMSDENNNNNNNKHEGKVTATQEDLDARQEELDTEIQEVCI